MAATILQFPLLPANDNTGWNPPAPTTRAQRRLLEQTIDRLIALLDESDGDIDMEDDDPAGDPLDMGEGQEGNYPIMATLPKYDVDQSNGPTNWHEACREHNRAERERDMAYQRELMSRPRRRAV